ncbi:MAG: acyl-CoA dehydrogenase family protein [Thermoleophilia bacterium]|nr:acyl-CoA dehydrogenase family protein [Thermoleophilia bacterium]
MILRQNRPVNQPPPLEGYDLFAGDRALVEAVEREGPPDAEARLSALGRELGVEPLEWGRLANEHPPALRRDDEVEFHPAWHALLELGVEHAIHASPWLGGSHVERAAAFMLLSEVEAGVCCPLSMTHAAVPALRATPELAREWEPRLTSRLYEPGLLPAEEKAGALAGMSLTEVQGGSDLRANETEARPGAHGEAELQGAKWFCSAPMCDAFLVTAQSPAGLSCYLVPRVLPDGSRNAIRIVRLKDKLGNRSNASAEIELEGAWGRLVGEEGRGIPTVAEMINHTRLDCALGSAALMRRAVAEATHHAAHRVAFGAALADQPLMRNVLADLCLESEAATALVLRVARAYDEEDAPFRRLATAVAKYWTCKVAPGVVAEALECLGGNGYVEESVLPRLYREAPLNSIWEGSGNVAALDVLRIVHRQPEALEAFLAELEPELRPDLPAAEEWDARRLAETLAVALQATLLVRFAPAEPADLFVASRVQGGRGRAYGTLADVGSLLAVVERHRPAVHTVTGVGTA